MLRDFRNHNQKKVTRPIYGRTRAELDPLDPVKSSCFTFYFISSPRKIASYAAHDSWQRNEIKIHGTLFTEHLPRSISVSPVPFPRLSVLFPPVVRCFIRQWYPAGRSFAVIYADSVARVSFLPLSPRLNSCNVSLPGHSGVHIWRNRRGLVGNCENLITGAGCLIRNCDECV